MAIVPKVPPKYDLLTGKRKKRAGTPRVRKGPSGRHTGGTKKGTKYSSRAATKFILADVLTRGITPLELMLNIMRKEVPDQASVQQRLVWREQAMKAAVSAAPYCHPRLSSMVNPLDPAKPPEQDINVKIKFVGDDD